MARFRDYHPEQPELFGYVDPQTQLPDDHIARFIDELVDQLDLSAFEQHYSDFGSKGYDPRLHLKVFFLSYIEGVTSSRKVMSHCQRDLAFVFLCRGQTPDFRTIARFRQVHRNDIRDLFVQVLRVARDMGMVKLGRVVIDSTTMRANASRNTISKAQRLDEELGELDQYLERLQENDGAEDDAYGECRTGEELPAELADGNERKKKIREALDRQRKLQRARQKLESSDSDKVSVTDPDSYFRIDGITKRSVLGYGAQVAMSEDGVIIATDVHPKNDDQGALLPVVDQVIDNLDDDLRQSLLLADSGYFKTDFIEELLDREIESLIPDGFAIQLMNGATPENPRQGFHYDSETDSYICPKNQRLGFQRITTEKGSRRQKTQRVYTNTAACKSCPAREQCVGTKFPYKRLKVTGHPGTMEPYRAKFTDPENQKKYKFFRKSIEKIFGHIKGNQRIRQFSCRGSEMVKAEWALLCTAYNIMRMHGKQKKRATA